MVSYLVAEEGPLAGLVITLEESQQWILGRDPASVFQVLEDPMVSRKHLVIHLDHDEYFAENLSSTNPAALNGEAITEAVKLSEGDLLQIGSSLFRFTFHNPQTTSEKDAFSENHPTIFDDEDPLESFSLHQEQDSNWLLKVISGPNTGAEFGLEPNHEYIIGKDPNQCDIIFQDLSVSRKHASLAIAEDGTMTITDLQSRNGTLVNGKTIEDPKDITSQDLIALGTTSFLIIDREQTRETIYAPNLTSLPAYEKAERVEELKEQDAIKHHWKDMRIPKRHLVIAGSFSFLVVLAIFASLSLFKGQKIEISQTEEKNHVEETLSRFPGVQYSFNPATGKIFLTGDMLTQVEHQELLYLLGTMPYVVNIDDALTIDELVSSDMNAFIMKNPKWRGVSMIALTPGKFILKGYVQTLDDAAALSEYMTVNFPYNEKLDNQVVVQNNLEAEIQSVLLEKGLVTVSFQLSTGEVILAGRVGHDMKDTLDDTIQSLKRLAGIRSVKSFVIVTATSSTRIDLSDKYQVSGTSKYGNVNQYVVINGQILSQGDTLDGMLITEIASDDVLLEKDGLKFKINYNHP